MRPSERIAQLEIECRRANCFASDDEVRSMAMKRYLDEQWEAREAKRQQPAPQKQQRARA